MYFFVSIKEADTGLIYLNQTYDIDIVEDPPPVIVEDPPIVIVEDPPLVIVEDTPLPTCDDDEVLVILP